MLLKAFLASPMFHEIYAQACLTPRLGGLGLKKVEDDAAFAFNASWHEAQKTAKEVWARPVDQPEK